MNRTIRPGRLCGIAAAAAVAGFLTAGAAAAQGDLSPRQLAAVRINIADVVAREPDLPLAVRQRQEALSLYYGEDGGELLWLDGDRATDLIVRLRAAAEDGLDPASYPADHLAGLAAAVGETDIRGLAIIELHFSAAFLEYASDIQVGRFLPRKVDPNFFVQKREIDQLAALQGLAAASSLQAFLDAWEPSAPQYGALKQALAEYAALAEAGGWPQVPLGQTLKPGMVDPRIPALRARLAVTDGASPTAIPGTENEYDTELVAAVSAFQARHGLDIDGLVGNATIVALNVPVERRIDEIVVAMERWRWMPEDLGDDHLLVNIAGFELTRVANGQVADEMAVVVGKPYSKTPAFSDTVRYLEFNPYWNVPAGIAVREELPRLRQNPGSLASAGFEAVRGDTVYPVTAINWSRYGPGNFPFSLRQRPGPRNALGSVKFMFPNQFNVYLHDTPSRSLFARSERAFSHGCIRLSRPLDLATAVLAEDAGWDRGRVDTVVASGKRTVVNLNQPLPIHISYFTAWVDNGQPNFRNDIYQQDAKLVAALDGRAIAW